MFRSCRRLFLLVGAVLLATLATLPGRTTATPAPDTTTTLTIMTNANMMAGLTPKTAGEGGSGSISSWFHYYGALWNKRFPHVRIHEIFVPGANGSNVMNLEATKTILAVNAGNPPDLIGTDNYLGLLVGRHALMNLDNLYQRAGITPGYFLPSMASFARVNSHWYGLPGASNPSANDILYVPQLVKAAGWDPNQMPRTWDTLWAATQKVTAWDSKGNLVRIGLPVNAAANTDQINLFCGSYATYDPATTKFHANLPCIKDYFRYELRLLKFYGGVAKYTKFTSGDATVWSCSSKAYIPTGKILFAIDAYWSGGQMDTCYNLQWALSPAPTPHGTAAEAQAVRTAAWLLAIPRGAKNPQLAFDFVQFTNWVNGYLMGPTTNGYVKAGQGAQWANTFDQVEAQVRANHHYPGNPMVNALQVVTKESAVGQVSIPNDVANSYYTDQLARAWQQIEYGRATVDQALNQVQHLVDTQQRFLHTQEGS